MLIQRLIMTKENGIGTVKRNRNEEAPNPAITANLKDQYTKDKIPKAT